MGKPIDRRIAERLDAWMEQAYGGADVKRLAESIDASVSTVYHWMTCLRQPGRAHLKRLQEAGVNLAYLRGESDVMFSDTDAGRAFARRLTGGSIADIGPQAAARSLIEQIQFSITLLEQELAAIKNHVGLLETLASTRAAPPAKRRR